MSPVRVAVVAVLVLDAVLLALTELAWLTAATGGGAWVPASVVAALVTTPALIRVADRAMPRTRAPLLVLGGWAAGIVVVGVWSPAGPGTLPGDYRALLLLAAGLLPGLVAVLRRPATRAEPVDAPASSERA